MYSREQNNTTHSARHGAANTPEHSDDIYLPSSSLIGDPDTVAWLRATRCTAAGRHRASQAAIACTPSLHRTPPFQAANTKALLVLSGRGAAVALACGGPPRPLSLPFARASRADARTKTGVCAKEPCAHTPMSHVLGFFTCDHHAANGRDLSRIKSARASKGVKRDRTGSPPRIPNSISYCK